MKFWKWLQETPTRKLWILVGILLCIVVIMALNACAGTPTQQGQWVEGLDEAGKTIRVWVNMTGQQGTPWGVIAVGVSGLLTGAAAIIKTIGGDKGHNQNAEKIDTHADEIAALKAEIAALKKS